MKKLFNNVLLPVEQGANNDTAIGNAILLANQLQCNLHILYLLPARAARPIQQEPIREEILARYDQRMEPPLALVVGGYAGPPLKGIGRYCKRNRIDLVLLIRQRRPLGRIFQRPLRLFTGGCVVNANQLPKKVDCPVLSMSLHANLMQDQGLMQHMDLLKGPKQPFVNGLHNIVLPVGDMLPRQKLLLATYLGRISNSTIHLVSCTDGSQVRDQHGLTESLQHAYRLLRENTDLQVKCHTLPGENLAEIAWQYARNIKADLILIAAGRESMLSGFLNKLQNRLFSGACSRSIASVSAIPVMSVA